MSPTGRPKGESLSAQREGSPVNVRRRLMLVAPCVIAGWPLRGHAMFNEGQHAHSVDLEIRRRTSMRFWLHLPRGYHGDAEPWPTLVFLHGSGERGTDLERVKAHGPPKLVARRPDFPFVLVSPQLPDRESWDPHALHALLEALKPRLRIDADRVYATGLSLGGHGTWGWAAEYPQDLAAIAPVCGFGDPARACRLKHVPVRAYHGAADTVVPVAAQQAIVEALRACGGEAQFIVYPGVGHDAWNPAYDDADLYRWLLAQRRRAATR